MEVSNSVQMQGFLKKAVHSVKRFFSFLFRAPIGNIARNYQLGPKRIGQIPRITKTEKNTKLYKILSTPSLSILCRKARAGHLVLDNFSCMQKTEKILSEPKKLPKILHGNYQDFFFFLKIFILVPHTKKNWKITAVQKWKKTQFFF